MEEAFPTQTVTGLLLCQAATNRFAFLAEHVSTIEPYREGAAPHASVMFNQTSSTGKIVRHASGAGVGVDWLEVHGEDVPLLPPPRLMLAGVGGSLYGFVALTQGLFPVLRLADFARYLSSYSAGKGAA